MAILIYLFRLSCDVYYRISFSQSYSYYLFDYGFSLVNFIVSWIFTIVLSLRFRKTFNKTQKLSTYIVFILYLLSFIPTMTLCSYGNYSLKFTVLVSVYWTIIILLEYYFCAQKNRGYSNKSQTLIKSKTKNNLLTTILSVVVACCILGFSYYYKGFQINLNLDDVYVLRYGNKVFKRCTSICLLMGWNFCCGSLCALIYK